MYAYIIHQVRPTLTSETTLIQTLLKFTLQTCKSKQINLLNRSDTISLMDLSNFRHVLLRNLAPINFLAGKVSQVGPRQRKQFCQQSFCPC
jgi:hypothetical protein